jgi:hypothetical protein
VIRETKKYETLLNSVPIIAHYMQAVYRQVISHADVEPRPVADHSWGDLSPLYLHLPNEWFSVAGVRSEILCVDFVLLISPFFLYG